MPLNDLINQLQARGIPVTEEREDGKWRHTEYYTAARYGGITAAMALWERQQQQYRLTNQ